MKFETLRGANARKVLLVVGIMAAHALGEGSGVGVSFCGKRGWSQVRFVCLKPVLSSFVFGVQALWRVAYYFSSMMCNSNHK